MFCVRCHRLAIGRGRWGGVGRFGVGALGQVATPTFWRWCWSLLFLFPSAGFLPCGLFGFPLFYCLGVLRFAVLCIIVHMLLTGLCQHFCVCEFLHFRHFGSALLVSLAFGSSRETHWASCSVYLFISTCKCLVCRLDVESGGRCALPFGFATQCIVFCSSACARARKTP
jgi:hypothetical protein